MPGVPGSGGPVPKRSNQRRRRNKPEVEITQAEAGATVEAPAANESWHPVAARWYESLSHSGQARFYEPSDWATAYLLAESMSRELKPQPLVIGTRDNAEVEWVAQPPKGASLAAWLKAMTSLMVTEGDRRRLRLELNRAVEGEEDAGVSELDDYRSRLRSG